MASRLHRSGWLTKRGQVVKNWKRRWFVVDPEALTLTYYTDETRALQKGSLSLAGATFLDAASCESAVAKQHCFGVVAGPRTLYVIAADAADCAEWLRILAVVARHRPPPPPQEPGADDDDNRMADRPDDARHSHRDPVVASAATAPVVAEGPWRDLTATFGKLRDSGTREHARHVERLKNRVKALLPGPPPGLLSSVEKFEQGVVPWEKDSAVSACPQCHAAFSLVGSVRRAHCRLCGRVVCGTPGCTDPVSLRDLAVHLKLAPASAKPLPDYDVVRVCAECYATLNTAGSASAGGPAAPQTPLLKLAAALAAEQAKADALLADYAPVCAGLRRHASPLLQQQAAAMKQSILASFDRAQALAQQIERLGAGDVGPQRAKLQASMRAAAAAWQQPRSLALQTMA